MGIIAFLKKQTNYRVPGTVAWKTRQRRMNDFNDWFESVFMCDEHDNTLPIRILDIGGVPEFWKYLGFSFIDRVSITTLNLEYYNIPDELKNVVTAVKGTAIDMREFEDNSFDLVFSNSVIEHVGNYDNQREMAIEMRRLGTHGYLQTPNKAFFMEPHFLFPFFQFIPKRFKAELLYRFDLGHYKKSETRSKAMVVAQSVNLLSYKQLSLLFPDVEICKEKWMGLTKSFILKW